MHTKLQCIYINVWATNLQCLQCNLDERVIMMLIVISNNISNSNNDNTASTTTTTNNKKKKLWEKDEDAG